MLTINSRNSKHKGKQICGRYVTALCVLICLLLLVLTECSGEKNSFSNSLGNEELEQVYHQFGEPSLEKEVGGALTVRLFIRPAFSNPYFVSIKKTGGNYLLVAKKMLGKGGYQWGGELLNLTKQVPLQAGDLVWNKLQNHEIWRPFSEYESTVMTGMTDGDIWIIEAYDGVQVQKMLFRDPRALGDHAIDKRLRDPGPYLELKKSLLSIAKIDLERPEPLE